MATLHEPEYAIINKINDSHSTCAAMGKPFSVITKQRLPAEAVCQMLPEEQLILCARDKLQTKVFPKTYLTLFRHTCPQNTSPTERQASGQVPLRFPNDKLQATNPE